MKNSMIAAIVLLLCFVFVVPCFSQHREYVVFGKIVDNNNTPIPGVKITLLDETSGRLYEFKTDKTGKFKYAGLPHAEYRVTMEKEGYKAKTDKWDLSKTQQRMQKVDFHTIVMPSEGQLARIEMGKKLKKGYEDAKALIEKERYDEAIGILKGLVREKDDEAALLYLLGTAYLRKGEYAGAIPLFTRVIQLDSSFAGGHFQLGLCFQRSGELERALESYRRVLELEPKNFIALYNVGLILYERDRAVEALPYFERALVIDGGDAGLLEMIGLCYLRTENYKKALEYLEKARDRVTDAEKLKSLDELISGLKKASKN